MRRIRAILALACVGFGVTAFSSPVGAHVCTNPVVINVGQRVNINFGVAAEEQAVVAVDVAVPDGFALTEPVAFNGWRAARDGAVVRFTDGAIKQFACEYFTFVGEAERKGALFASITVRYADGTERVYDDPNPYAHFPALGIYAGVDVPAPPTRDASDATTRLVFAGGAALVAGGVAALVLLRRMRRQATP